MNDQTAYTIAAVAGLASLVVFGIVITVGVDLYRQ